MRVIKKIFQGLVYLFALAGFVLISGYFAVRFKLTNVPGIIDSNTRTFSQDVAKLQKIPKKTDVAEVRGDMTVASLEKQINYLSKVRMIRQENYCKIEVIGNHYPKNAANILRAAEKTQSDPITMKMVTAVELRLKDIPDIYSKLEKCRDDKASTRISADYSELRDGFSIQGENVFQWANDAEWNAISQATMKEKGVIDEVSQEVDIEPRLVVASMIVEQLRLFHSEREVFKRFFEPLKILCSANKISLGVMGIKEATAINIENHIKDSSSPYYLGPEYENMLNFNSGDIVSERYDRLVDDKNHYYSYLYGALYLKQFMKQWKDAGYDIDYRPEILGTLFNVGFSQSKPKPDPKVGGSEISIGERSYSFGSLVYEFYYSGEMLDDFPFQIEGV